MQHPVGTYICMYLCRYISYENICEVFDEEDADKSHKKESQLAEISFFAKHPPSNKKVLSLHYEGTRYLLLTDKKYAFPVKEFQESTKTTL